MPETVGSEGVVKAIIFRDGVQYLEVAVPDPERFRIGDQILVTPIYGMGLDGIAACPNCHSVLRLSVNNKDGLWWIACHREDGRICTQGAMDPERDAAIADWNRRANVEVRCLTP